MNQFEEGTQIREIQSKLSGMRFKKLRSFRDQLRMHVL